MESLSGDLLPRDDARAELLGVRLHSFDRAVEAALREWERRASALRGAPAGRSAGLHGLHAGRVRAVSVVIASIDIDAPAPATCGITSWTRRTTATG